MSGTVSKKLKFKGDKKTKKKRSHREMDDQDDGFGGLEQGEPTDWIFPSNVLEVTGPSFIILPSWPPTCLAWEPTRQRVIAAPVTLPVAPAGEDDLTPSEIMEVLEPTDVNQVWVISRLSGSEDVISLRTSSGTFLTAASSGALTANTPSRGPLESFVPSLSTTVTGSSSRSTHPSFTLQSSSVNYISLSIPDAKPAVGLVKPQMELRADATEIGTMEQWKVKCQREFVMKARTELQGGSKGKRKLDPSGRRVDHEGTAEDELDRNTKYQSWTGGKHVLSEADRKEIKRARKEGKIAEAMLDRRAALKSDKFAK